MFSSYLYSIINTTNNAAAGGGVIMTLPNSIKKIQNSILTKLLSGVIIPVIFIFVFSSILILFQTKERIRDVTKHELIANSEARANAISEFFTKNMEVTKQLGANYELEKLFKKTVPGVRMEQLPDFPDFMQTMKNICALDTETISVSWIADVDSSQCLESSGWISEDGEWDIKTRDWFNEVQKDSKTVVTEPYLNSSTGLYVLSVITPVYDSTTKELLGVAATDISIEQLRSMMSTYQLGDTGFFLLLSKENKVLYHPNTNYIDKELTQIALSDNIISAFQNSQVGFYTYQSEEIKTYGYLSIAGDSKWKVLTGLPDKEFYYSYRTLRLIIAAIFLFGLILLSIVILVISSGIIKPLKSLTQSANSIAAGNLDIQLVTTSQDEIGQLAGAINQTVIRLKDYIAYIDEVSFILQQIADGNLDYCLSLNYIGEFEKIKQALESLSISLSETLYKIRIAADEVTNESKQVANGAQILSQGSIDQSNSVEELCAMINDISEKINTNVANIQSANHLFKETSCKADEGNKNMKEMVEAMNLISENCNQISAIVTVIDDISFQTNLLALNAAIEASRAGEAGKGFAIVAEQVRELSEKTSEAVKHTDELIRNTLTSVNNGITVADKTNDSLQSIVKKVKDTSELFDKVTKVSTEQAASVNQISIGVDQISSVVQTNSATAQESAAASEELSGQAQLMKSLIEKFILKSTNKKSN